MFRGSVLQVFSLLGLAAGIWTAVLVSQWVGAHWQSARPAVVFLVLRWLVAVLAALAVSSLVVWWGEMLAGAVQQSPVGWLDRAMGFVVGATFGTSVAALILLAAIRVPWPSQPHEWA
ncbi:MAG: CvpA family protein, partial [Candidatus Eiseniibacteriota bacterium]